MQESFPLVQRPFATIGEKVGMTEDEVISRVKRLAAQGSIRKIQGTVDKRKLGIKAKTLVGMNVPPERLDEVIEIVNKFDGVTHDYVRTHPRYNLWYVIEGTDKASLQKANEAIAKATGITDTVDLPGLKNFKLLLKLDVREQFDKEARY